MSDLAERESPVPPLLRDRSGVQRVTNIELFFDLVYVFAVTQLSHYLIGHSTLTGALHAGLLLAMVWLVWAYTTWVTNWLDPELMAVRLLLVVLMLVSLAMSASLPRAFEDLGLWVGGAYALQQIGRTVFMVIALAGIRWRPTSSGSWPGAWSAARSPWRAGWSTATPGPAVARVGLRWTPRRGRRVRHPGTRPACTLDSTIEGGHFAERCESFHPDRAGRVDRASSGRP